MFGKTSYQIFFFFNSLKFILVHHSRAVVTNICESESESARYSIHLKKSITWSARGNGQKIKDEQ